MLWVSVYPGCGKSVLVRHLVDDVLKPTRYRSICYFFFKDIEDQKSIVTALRCILHQLFDEKRNLLSGKILNRLETMSSCSFSELWEALMDATESHQVICLLDAIDECDPQGWSQLMQKLSQLRDSNRNCNLRFLLTSRPYEKFRRDLHLVVTHLDGDSDAEKELISEEIKVFIKARVEDIGLRCRLTDDEQKILLRRLSSIPNRTYLWVYLTLDLIEEDINISQSGIDEVISQLPSTVGETYNKILSRSNKPEKAKFIFHIILAAERPLTLSEMALAVALHEGHNPHETSELANNDRFRDHLSDICGLFVSIVHEKIHLIHQSAKEFLVQGDNVDGDLEWNHSFPPRESHRILAEICISHLLSKHIKTPDPNEVSQLIEDNIFLDYSAKHWASHLRESEINTQKSMTALVLRICNPNTRRFQTWFKIHWTATERINSPQGLTTLMVASYYGLSAVVKHLLKLNNTMVNAKDRTYKRTALCWAARNGFHVVVGQLIKGGNFWMRYLPSKIGKGAKIDSRDVDGRTPLTHAVWNGNLATVELLLKAKAWVHLEDENRGTPLSYAIVWRREEVIALFRERGIGIRLQQDVRLHLLLCMNQRLYCLQPQSGVS